MPYHSPICQINQLSVFGFAPSVIRIAERDGIVGSRNLSFDVIKEQVFFVNEALAMRLCVPRTRLEFIRSYLDFIFLEAYIYNHAIHRVRLPVTI